MLLTDNLLGLDKTFLTWSKKFYRSGAVTVLTLSLGLLTIYGLEGRKEKFVDLLDVLL